MKKTWVTMKSKQIDIIVYSGQGLIWILEDASLV